VTRLRQSPASVRQGRQRFGQHFLAPAWADKVVKVIAPSPDDRFVEIGPGRGALTSRLAARAGHVTAIEIDRDLAAGLQRQLPPNVDLVVADILDVDLAPFLAGGPLRVAGNLPYNISSPILFKLLAVARTSAGLVDATVMLQLEVADRLLAPPGTKDYGVLTIFTALQADVQRLLTLPPGAFRPPPKVHSAIVRLTFKPSPLPAESEAAFEKMVRTMFMQRRKTLSNAVRPYAAMLGRDPRAVLSAAGIDPARRPETLTQDDLLRLVSEFSSKPKA
jgi:16S rRNA (adenine1518-N6/adenine1519-N6)-dimethyltransferase